MAAERLLTTVEARIWATVDLAVTDMYMTLGSGHDDKLDESASYTDDFDGVM